MTDHWVTGIDLQVLAEVCEAVVGAARPPILRSLPPNRHDAARHLWRSIDERADVKRAAVWWGAFGEEVTQSLMDLRGIDRGFASHLIGASLQAHIIARLALGTDPILRLGEEALIWLNGAGSGWPASSPSGSGTAAHGRACR